MENKITYYTAEKFAKRARVTSRTLRYYDKIGLLKPSKHTESGYRLYCDEDMIRLQRIIALRYLQFSLPEIQLTLEKDEAKGVLDSLRSQREAFEKERDHLDHIIGTIRRLEENQDCSWQDLTRLIQMINSDEEIQWRFVESWRKEREDLFESKNQIQKVGGSLYFDSLRFKKENESWNRIPTTAPCGVAMRISCRSVT